MTKIYTRGRRSARLASIALIALSAVSAASPLVAQSGPAVATREEREAVRRAVLDYVEGFYEGDSVKLVAQRSPGDFQVRILESEDSTRYAGEQMKYPEFFDYARRVKQNNRQAPPTAAKIVDVLRRAGSDGEREADGVVGDGLSVVRQVRREVDDLERDVAGTDAVVGSRESGIGNRESGNRKKRKRRGQETGGHSEPTGEESRSSRERGQALYRDGCDSSRRSE